MSGAATRIAQADKPLRLRAQLQPAKPIAAVGARLNDQPVHELAVIIDAEPLAVSDVDDDVGDHHCRRDADQGHAGQPSRVVTRRFEVSAHIYLRGSCRPRDSDVGPRAPLGSIPAADFFAAPGARCT